MKSQRRSTTHLPMPPSLRSLKAMTGSPLSRATSTTNSNRGFRKYAQFSSLVESYRLPARTCPEVNTEGQTTLLGDGGEAEPECLPPGSIGLRGRVMEPPTRRTVTIHGHELSYLDSGTGSVVLFIHGILGSQRQWTHLIDRLHDDHRVIVPDLFGHGESDKPMGDYSLGAHAAT